MALRPNRCRSTLPAGFRCGGFLRAHWGYVLSASPNCCPQGPVCRDQRERARRTELIAPEGRNPLRSQDSNLEAGGYEPRRAPASPLETQATSPRSLSAAGFFASFMSLSLPPEKLPARRRGSSRGNATGWCGRIITDIRDDVKQNITETRDRLSSLGGAYSFR